MQLGIFDADNAVPIRITRRVYSTAGTFSYAKPANLIAIDVELEGGNGGGGNSTNTGFGGGRARRVIPANLLPSQVTVVIGAGGAGAAGPTGNPGGATSFGNIFSATGGGPGGAGPVGTGIGGDFNGNGHGPIAGVRSPLGCMVGSGGGCGNGAAGEQGIMIITEYLKGAA